MSFTVHFAHDLVLSSLSAGFGGDGSRGASEGSATGGENLVQPAPMLARCGRSGAVDGAEAAKVSGSELSLLRILDAKEGCGSGYRRSRGASDGALRVSWDSPNLGLLNLLSSPTNLDPLLSSYRFNLA